MNKSRDANDLLRQKAVDAARDYIGKAPDITSELPPEEKRPGEPERFKNQTSQPSSRKVMVSPSNSARPPLLQLVPTGARTRDGARPVVKLIAPPPGPPPLPFINISRWDDEPVPELKWTVHNRIPRRQCCLFTGEGSTGKSSADLHRSAAHVLGRDWLGTMPELGPALFIDAEDPEDVIHWRLAAICRHYNVKFADLHKGGLHLMSFAGKDAVLATVRGGKIEPTPLYHQISQAVGDIKPISITIASSANVFAGNEIDRSQVQQFISLLTRLAMLADGSVNLISHPSLAGINTDTGLSGNTAWHNAVRSRMYLKGVKPSNGEEPDNDLRELVFKKNNYGPVSETIPLRYQNGLFLPVTGGATSLDRLARDAKVDEVFLDLLRRFTIENRKVGASAGKNYAPFLFALEDEAKRHAITGKLLEAAMRRLFKLKKIGNEPCGKPSRPSFRLAIKA